MILWWFNGIIFVCLPPITCSQAPTEDSSSKHLLFFFFPLAPLNWQQALSVLYLSQVQIWWNSELKIHMFQQKLSREQRTFSSLECSCCSDTYTYTHSLTKNVRYNAADKTGTMQRKKTVDISDTMHTQTHTLCKCSNAYLKQAPVQNTLDPSSTWSSSALTSLEDDTELTDTNRCAMT